MTKENEMNLYILHWSHKEICHKRHSGPMSKKDAEWCVNYGNKQYPHIRHWIEKFREHIT